MRWPLLLTALLAVACGSPPEPEPTPATTCAPLPQHIAVRLNAAADSGKPQSHPSSRVGGTMTVAVASVEDAIAKSLPRVIAQGRNVSAGAAGRTTFEIIRKEPRLATSDAGLSIQVPLNGEIHLCKPLGGVCIEYGMCRPEWRAEVLVHSPWQLRNEPKVDLDVQITKGCVLSPVKVDVTSELRKITDAEVSKIKKQLRREVDRFHDDLKKQIKRGLEPVRLTNDVCVGFDVDEVDVSLTREDETHIVNFETRGRLSLDCEPSHAAAANPSPTTAGFAVDGKTRVRTHRALHGETEAVVDTSVPLLNLTAELQSRIPNQQVRLSGLGDDLLVEVSGWRGCASGWALLHPTPGPAGIELTPRETSDATLVAALGSSTLLAQTHAVHQQRLDQLVTALKRPMIIDSDLLPNNLRIQPQANLDATELGVLAAPNAVVFRTTLRGSLDGRLTSEPQTSKR